MFRSNSALLLFATNLIWLWWYQVYELCTQSESFLYMSDLQGNKRRDFLKKPREPPILHNVNFKYLHWNTHHVYWWSLKHKQIFSSNRTLLSITTLCLDTSVTMAQWSATQLPDKSFYMRVYCNLIGNHQEMDKQKTACEVWAEWETCHNWVTEAEDYLVDQLRRYQHSIRPVSPVHPSPPEHLVATSP